MRRNRGAFGVPQGGSASPLLYCIFVHDIAKYFPQGLRYLEFADDCKMYHGIDSITDSLVLQRGIDGMVRWCNENGMLLSPSKCVSLKPSSDHHVYTLEGSALPTASVMRDLGVQMAHNLSFDHHIAVTVSSCTVLINTVFRWFAICDPSVYIRIYTSLVLPKLLYCSPIYAPYKVEHWNLLEGVQKCFLKRLRWRCPGAVLPDLPSIQSRFDKQDKNFLRLLASAGLLERFFDVSYNTLRSSCTIRTKALAASEAINHLFSWGIVRRINEGDAALRAYLLLLYPITPLCNKCDMKHET